MQTKISEQLLDNYQVREAEKILRACVHCGFCTATCPTYQLLGDELDGPRGRIYLIKQVLEGNEISRKTQTHLDRCLTCRSCETTCPSGVRYSQLLNVGRDVVNEQVERPGLQKIQQFMLRKLLLNRALFSSLVYIGQQFRPVLPPAIKRHLPGKQRLIKHTGQAHETRALLVNGCVQPALKPSIDHAARVVFDRIGIQTIEPPATCCGSLSHHLNAKDEALSIIRNNIDHWLPLIEQHAIGAITMTASGCGIAIKEYEQLLADDTAYADKAKTISRLYRDPSEIVADALEANPALIEKLTTINGHAIRPGSIIAFHPPCTLQHGLQLKNRIEPILEKSGFTVKPIRDAHLCCGSAGTYSITQKALSQQLLTNKLSNINKISPELIVTANIGCQLHLQSGTDIPVRHWLELFI